MSGASRVATLARVAVLFAALLALGRLASRAWLEGPDLDVAVPTTTPLDPGAPSADLPTPFLLAILDGLRAEATAAGDDPVMPLWRELAAEGASGVAMTGEPTLTAACVRTLLTGRNPDLAVAAKNFSAPVVRENLLERLAGRGARIGHAGDAAAYQLARPWYGAADVFAVRDQGPADRGATDDRAVPFALALIADGVDSLTVHLTRPDHTGHTDGASLDRGTQGELSPYAAACRRTDEQLRAIVGAFRARHQGAVVVLAADHGMTERGTHGGGEAAARRAPFVAVGPRVVTREGVEISQAGLASTMAVWLDVEPLAFSEAPPALDLTTLDRVGRQRVLAAYVDARLAVAATTGAKDLSDAIAVRRARIASEGPDLALARLAAESQTLNDGLSTAHDPWRIAAALWLACVLWLLVADERASRGRRGDVIALMAALGAALSVAVATPVVVVAAVSLAALISLATRIDRVPVRDAVGSLAVFVALSAVAVAIKPLVEAPPALTFTTVGLASAAALVAGAITYLLWSRSRRDRLLAYARSSPSLLLVTLGVLVGFPTSLRPFVDPFVPFSLVYALIGVNAVALACFSASARVTAPRARFVALAALCVALAIPFAEANGSHLVTTAVVASAVVGFAVATARATGTTRSRLGFAMVSLAVALALVERGSASRSVALYWLAVAASLGALVFTRRDTGDLPLVTRITASIALVLLFERTGSGAAVPFVIFGIGAFAGSRIALPSTRAGWIAAATVIALLRVTLFHATGSTESWSTVDAGAGVVPGIPLDLVHGSSWSPAIVANVVVQALRYATPWIVLLAMAMRMLERQVGPAAPALRRLTTDVVALLAVRGATLVLALVFWWTQSWWVSTARAVFAFAAADVVLVIASAALVGAFSRSRDGAPVRSEASAVGEPI